MGKLRIYKEGMSEDVDTVLPVLLMHYLNKPYTQVEQLLTNLDYCGKAVIREFESPTEIDSLVRNLEQNKILYQIEV